MSSQYLYTNLAKRVLKFSKDLHFFKHVDENVMICFNEFFPSWGERVIVIEKKKKDTLGHVENVTAQLIVAFFP